MAEIAPGNATVGSTPGTLDSIRGEGIGQLWAPPLPWDWLPILAINVAACFLIGWLYARERWLHPHRMNLAELFTKCGRHGERGRAPARGRVGPFGERQQMVMRPSSSRHGSLLRCG